jgi:ABC-type histidine transport system ATPase subunit
MHDSRSEPSAVQQDRNVESAVLAIVIERHPTPVAVADVIEEMISVADAPGRAEAVERAIDELARVGLLHRRDALIEPTRASLRMTELETGL